MPRAPWRAVGWVSVLGAAALSSCRPGAPDAGGGAVARAAVVDGLGRSVPIENDARRVLSLAPSTTEILHAIDAGGLLIARDERSDWPRRVASLPSVGSAYPRPNLEEVVVRQPDLVLAAGMHGREVVASLERLGLRVYAARPARRLEDVYLDIASIGSLTGKTSRATRLVDSMRERVEEVRRRTRGREAPLVFYEIDATDPGRPWTAGPGSLIDDLLEMAGARNIATAGGEPYFQLSVEELIARDPEVVLLGSGRHTGGSLSDVRALSDVRERSGWSAIRAVRSGRVHVVDDDLVARPGPRVVEGLESLARLLHPEVFP